MPSLTRDEAVERAELLRVHAYQVDLDLVTPTEFESTTTVTFTCTRPGAETFIELRPVGMHEAWLNGNRLSDKDLADNRLLLRRLEAENELTVRASMPYSNAGTGLHRFVDPEDGATYLYAQSFLDDAQQVFACFDQPDLKAALTLSVHAPAGWRVAANAPVSAHGSEDGRWLFAATPPIPTYVVSLIAGPYHVRRDEHDGIPLGVYCRQSLASYLDQDFGEIIEVTKQCLDYFHRLFGTRYPFGKFDQAFVPEFNAGAMENAGLVTLRDDYVFRAAVTDAERTVRAATIAHELAHMWFGDLVTMRWWDDLWLNESFAEYLGYRATAEATRFTAARTSFSVGRKGWGYADDQRPSTHPVAPESVANAGLALLNFDGISYAKGASVLNQLAAWIGDDVFTDGLRAHVAANAFANATLDDLLSALATASGRDLRPWAQVWLRRAQVNTLRPEVVLDPDGRYGDVTVVQTAPAQYPTLRPHRIGIGVYADGQCQHRVEVDLDPSVDNGRTPVPSLRGVRAGDLLLVNDGDLTFAKIRLDDRDRAALVRTLPVLTDPLARALVWAAVLDTVRDAEMPASELVALCAAGLPAERDVGVFNDVIGFATANAVDRFLPEEQQPAARASLGSACLSALADAEPGASLQLAAARGFVAAAGPDDVGHMRRWLHGDAPPGLTVDSEMRWRLLRRLAALGEVGDDEIEAEYGRDRTALGAEHATRCRAARPDAAAKAEAWRIIVEDDRLSNRLLMAAAEGFWQPLQTMPTESYVERYFLEMPGMAARRTPSVVQAVATAAYPRYAVTDRTLADAQDLLGRDADPVLHRVVTDLTDELRRALAARLLQS
jgi:aminopeptidase N